MCYRYAIGACLINQGLLENNLGRWKRISIKFSSSECGSLTSVNIPNSVTSIEASAFNKCTALTSITIPNTLTSIEETAFAYCSGLTSITIPNTVTSIGQGAFENCSGLTAVNIPKSVKSIGKSAFYGCESLTSVTIPNSVTSIRELAFRDCKNLSEVRSKIRKPYVIGAGTGPYSAVFYGIPADATLYVPNGTKELYQATEGRKEFFANIVESDELSAIEGDLNGDEELDVTDVVELIDMVLAGTYDAVADINGDGEVDVTDVVELIDIVLAGE